METNVLIAVNSTEVEWIEISNKKCLRISIIGRLTKKTATKAVTQWKEEFALQLAPDEKAIVICNCIKMSSYDTDARKLWQNTISELKSQIGYFWIITDNKLFKMAAKTMGLVTRFKLLTVSSEDDIVME